MKFTITREQFEKAIGARMAYYEKLNDVKPFPDCCLRIPETIEIEVPEDEEKQRMFRDLVRANAKIKDLSEELERKRPQTKKYLGIIMNGQLYTPSSGTGSIIDLEEVE